MPDFYKEDKGHAGFGHNVTPFPGIHKKSGVENDVVEEDIILHMEDLNLTDFPLNIQNAILNHDRKKVVKERTIEEEKVEISKLLGEIDEELFAEQEVDTETAVSYSEIHRAELEKLCRESDMEANQSVHEKLDEEEFEQKMIISDPKLNDFTEVQVDPSEIFSELQRLKQKKIEPEVASIALPPRSARKKRKKETIQPETAILNEARFVTKPIEVETVTKNKVKPETEPYPNIVFAGFWLRTFAYLIDILMVDSFNRIVVNQLNEVANFSLLIGPFSLNQYLQFLVFVLYFMLFTKINHGQTIGKMIFGLRVVSLNGEKLTWGTVILREGLGRYVQRIFLPLYLMVGLTPKRQHLVDMVSKTSVISENLVKAYETK